MSAYAAISFDLNNSNCHLNIEAILIKCRNFNKVSGLVNNDTKIVYSVRFKENDAKVRDFFINTYHFYISNFEYRNDYISLIGDTLSVAFNEANTRNGYFSTSLSKRFK